MGDTCKNFPTLSLTGYHWVPFPAPVFFMDFRILNEWLYNLTRIIRLSGSPVTFRKNQTCQKNLDGPFC